MKVTKEQLKRIIKEELENMLNEQQPAVVKFYPKLDVPRNHRLATFRAAKMKGAFGDAQEGQNDYNFALKAANGDKEAENYLKDKNNITGNVKYEFYKAKPVGGEDGFAPEPFELEKEI